MKHFVAVIIVFLAAVATGQEVKHAPTVAQCQADQRTWDAALISNEGRPQGAIKETSEAILKWKDEMVDCIEVDPKNTNHYFITTSRAIIEVGQRQQDFIRRHGLAQQFTAEDEAGKR